ncbi:hypothetical protein FPRO05_10925 [Fusarium proliferatum]|uniref:F-box domain-containing protein n=1 Tax=Gibberella intermedia TaxID=948311 RepID=A0A365NAS1_GIBIN|nr:hypothetical protein FPRO05_10925 [Fusarium proliferatum]
MPTNNNYEPAAILFPLLNLSPEIVGMVIEEVDDMQTFISISQTCSSLRSICRNKRTVQNLFSSFHSGHKPEQQAAKIYTNLKFAARCPFLSPTSVENAFREAWPVFMGLQMEELLYPVAMALANHYFSLGLAKEGKLFLERIWNFHEPYELEISRMIAPGLLPIAKRLRQLTGGKGLAYQVIQTRISLLEQFEKARKPYFMLVRNQKISWQLWNECPLESVAAFFPPTHVRSAKLSFAIEGRTLLQAPIGLE